MTRRLLAAALVVLGLHLYPAGHAVHAQDAAPVILPMRERAALMDQWLERRLDTVVPELMRREGIDLWILIAREYNEDPVVETMLPATWLSARRRTILVFHDRGPEEGVERLAVARYDIGRFFESAWNPDEQPDQWRRLANLIAERDPRQIAVSRSATFALADGLAATEHEALREALPARYAERLVSGERLAVGWLERRIPEERYVYPMIVKIARQIIHEGLSEAAIQPGVTTTEDLQWWYRERIAERKLDAWFHPSVSVQRADTAEHAGSFAARPGPDLILPGDLLHVDFGITYLGLNTDTQQHAYVLRPGETRAPEGLERAFAVGNRLQDVLTAEFQEGRPGNDILKAALDQARAEGIQATIYTHPIGYHGHGAGPTIGLWDQQGGVPGKGDYPLFAHTAHSIELNAAVEVPEWDGKEVRIMLEENAYFDGDTTWYLDGRQTRLLLIPRAAPPSRPAGAVSASGE